MKQKLKLGGLLVVLGAGFGLWHWVPWIQDVHRYDQMFGGSRKILVAVHPRSGTIFTPVAFSTLEKVAQDVFLLPGIDRSTVTSFFSPQVRTLEMIEEGFRGHSVVPAGYSGTSDELVQVRENVYASPEGRRLLGANESAALVSAFALDSDPDTGRPVDPARLAAGLENIRHAYQNASIDIHMVSVDLRKSPDFKRDLEAMDRLFWPGVNVFIVLADGSPQSNLNPATVRAIDRMTWRLRQVPGVRAAFSLADYSRNVQKAYMEGVPQWGELPRTSMGLRDTFRSLELRMSLADAEGREMPIYVFLNDSQASTTHAVSRVAKDLASTMKTPGVSFHLVGRNAGFWATIIEHLYPGS